jgi:hypothetical protein
VAQLDVRLLIRYVRVVCIAFEPEEVVFAVRYAIEEYGSKCQPVLAGFESDVLVLVCCGVQHVLTCRVEADVIFGVGRMREVL